MCKNYDTSRRSFVTTLIVVAICLVIVTGSTFSLFTSKTGANIAVTAGKVEMTAVIDAATLALYSKGEPQTGKFYNGGSANFNDKHTELTLVNVTPGDSVSFNIVLTNDSTVDLQYRVTWTRDNALAPVLDATVDGASINSGTSAWTLWEAESTEKTKTLTVVIELPIDVNDDYELASTTIGFTVEAVQANATEEYEDMINPPVIPPVKETVKAPETNDAGETTESKEIPASEGGVSASVPAGVQLADGADELTLTVKQERESQANITLGGTETAVSLDVHIEGIADDNTVPMEINIPGVVAKGMNNGNIKVYHVENGVTNEMTQVAMTDAFTAHNQFKYDAVTGEIILNMASFSEVAVVSDAGWDGKSAESFNGGNGSKDKPYLIANASQLAYFRDQVDGGNTFVGKFIKLENDINLFNVNFDPIGWGYENNDWNVGDVAGKPFKGTFDGDGHVIRNLYQNGWDLEAENGTDYTYTNCGFGLFSAACDATIKNLTIYNANIVAECVEMGVVVGLAQGNCIFENINVYNSAIANYQRPAGGVVGEVSPKMVDGVAQATTHTFNNVTVGSDVVVGSLWGDFDAPVGGVIGAYWDDAGKTKVQMTNVTVACRLDVYNDVTYTYQWYAYRRAGMLIGNSEQTDGRTATATYLKCSDVKVYYDEWVDYHYCEFSESYNSPSWPFVRVEKGENCSAYSNPRWGVATDAAGKAVTDNHTHTNGDDHMVHLPFGQLYGGGQGVYGGGQTENYVSTHTGVTIVKYVYTITYMNDNKVLYVDYVDETRAAKTVNTANSTAQGLVEKWAGANITGTWKFGGWMNAGSTKIPTVEAGNKKDIVLYPYFNKPYTARFVDQKGNVLEWCMFHKEDLSKLDDTMRAAQSQLPNPGKDFAFDYWEVNANGTKVQYNENNFKNYSYDVTIYPVYRYTGNLKLTPVDNDNDGIIEYYMVEAVAELDKDTTIPGDVNGIPVKIVVRLYQNKDSIFGGYFDYASGVEIIRVEEGVEKLQHNSLAYSSSLNTVYLPSTLKTMAKNTFSRNISSDKKVLTIEYNGTKAAWDALVAASHDEWANGLQNGSTIKCIDGTYTLTDKSGWFSGSEWVWTPKTTN